MFDAVQVEFGPTRALESVSATLRAGEIVGLLGHNGAGKSTLFNVVSGVLPATSGGVIIDGVRAPEHTNPAEMAKFGVTVIHQEPALAPNLSVIDNLFLGQERLVPRGDWTAQARAALARVGSDVDLSREVGSLGLGERQLVDLARGLVRGELKILMLDEPTAALGRTETIALHSLIRSLAADGVTIVYVSHRLPDILDVCDRILILRAGRLEVDGSAGDFDGPSLSRALAPGATFDTLEKRAVATGGGLRLEGAFSEIEAYAGEVLGLFGMAAGSQFGLLEGLFGINGARTFSLGESHISIDSPATAVRQGVHLVPADRERDGLISGASAIDTVFLPWYGRTRGRGSWIGPRTGREAYGRARRELNVAGPEGGAPIDEFSGGNRQKHLVARWMHVQRPRLLLMAQPTQGVDVGARVDIAKAVREAAADGAVVLIASAESDEVALLCDRAYVLYEDRAVLVERADGTDFGGALVAALLSLSETTHKGVDR
ncbi:sugar ABC transporter ATP-binding protein [Microbacterium xylanilyticum]